MSSQQWERVDAREFLDDVARAGQQSYKLEPHAFVKPRLLPWLICTRCGLLSLRNALTGWCERMGYLHRRHPNYPHRVMATREAVS